jgi:pimeloyl-ACP methyl ester carboxylesterase
MAVLPHVMIIQGAWHNPVHYHLLIEELQRRGFIASCPYLPTCQDISKSYADDVAFIHAEITDMVNEDRDIIVIPHSYGGVVAAEALRGLEKRAGSKGGIVAVLFMSCFLPAPNQALLSEELVQAYGGPPKWISIGQSGETPILFVKPYDAMSAFYNLLPEDEARKWSSQLREHPAAAQQTPIGPTAAYSGWSVPFKYLVCTKDQALLPIFQDIMIQEAEKNYGIKIERVEILADHFAAIQCPGIVAQEVEQMVRANSL